MKRAMTVLILFFISNSICFSFKNNNVSPDGKYAFVREKNWEKGLPRDNIYELIIFDKRTKKPFKHMIGLFGNDAEIWSPDSRWIIAQTYTHYGCDVELYDIYSSKVIGINFDQYAAINQNKYGFEFSEHSPHTCLSIEGWDKIPMYLIVNYAFNGKNKVYEGKILFDINKLKIIKLFDNKFILMK
jgi:hypothetical protein